MGLISFLSDIFVPPPNGPEYDVEYLERCYASYDHHIRRSADLLRPLLYDKRYLLMTKKYDGDSYVGDLLSKVTYTYLGNIRSWVADEFIVKIKRFSSPHKTERRTISYRETSCQEYPDKPFFTANSHFNMSKTDAKRMMDALTFFTCDKRTPFMMKESLYDGKVSPQEVCRWYIGGKGIVGRNIARIEENIAKFMEFAKQNGVR